MEITVWNRQLLQTSINGDEEVKEATFNVFRQRSKLDIFLMLNTFHLCLQEMQRLQ